MDNSRPMFRGQGPTVIELSLWKPALNGPFQLQDVHSKVHHKPEGGSIDSRGS